MPLTNAEKQKAHRRRMAEKMARYEGALREIAGSGRFANTYASKHVQIAAEALNPTDPAKS